MRQHKFKPFSERQAQKNNKPANRIQAIDRKRFTREEVEAAIQRRANQRSIYQNR